MKRFTQKAVMAAVGALVGGSALAAAVNLDAASPTPIKYANEYTITTNVDLRHGTAADQTATTTFGASLGQDVAAYVRIDLVGGTFNGTPAATMFAVNDNAGAATVNVAQSGSTYVIFSVTPTAGNNLVSSNTATIDTDVGTAAGIRVTGKGGVTLQYRLFETLTAAANPTSSNTLKDTGAKNYITWTNALSTTATALTATADVAASPSYTAFTPSGTQPVGKLTVALDTTIAVPTTGNAVTAGTLLAATSDVVVTGDFTLARNDAGTYTGAALSRVFLNNNVNCAAGAPTVAAASALTATTATFTDVAAATLVADHWLCLTPEGTPEIVSTSFNASVDFVEQSGYSVSDVSGAAFGNVVRNGVRMVAPMVNVPAGSIARLVLTNTGSSARDYTISYVSENGTTVTPSGAAASGSLPAGKTTVIDLASTLTIAGGAPRTSLVVTVNAPQSQIDGLLQAVTTGSGGAINVSNYILSYKN